MADLEVQNEIEIEITKYDIFDLSLKDLVGIPLNMWETFPIETIHNIYIKYDIPYSRVIFPGYEHAFKYLKILYTITQLNDRLQIYNYLVNLSNKELIEFCQIINVLFYNNADMSLNKHRTLYSINDFLIDINPYYSILEFIKSHTVPNIIFRELNNVLNRIYSGIRFKKQERYFLDIFKDYVYGKLNDSSYEDICTDCYKYKSSSELLYHINVVTLEYMKKELNLFYLSNNQWLDNEDYTNMYTIFIENNLVQILKYYNNEMFNHFAIVNSL